MSYPGFGKLIAMPRLPLIIFFLATIYSVSLAQGRVNPDNHVVKGYFRKDGTYVQSHHRTNPNGTNVDNYSTEGNTNIWTRKPGWIQPDNKPLPSYSPPTYIAPPYTPKIEYTTNRNVDAAPTTPVTTAVPTTYNFSTNSYNSPSWSDGYYDLSAGNRVINYTNGRDEFNVAAPLKITYWKDRTYFSFDVYSQEIKETNGGAEGQLLLNGPYRFYDKAGTLRVTENYKNGLKHGLSFRYSESGGLVEKKEYTEGILTYFKFTDDQGTTYEMFGVLEQPGGRLLVSNQTGLYKKVEFFGSGRTKQTEYDPITKKTIQEYSEINGQRDGDSRRYFPNGRIKEKGTYKSGVPHGPFEIYYENGVLAMKGATADGAMHGEILAYKENGELEAKLNYKDGLLDGAFASFDHAKPIITGTYIAGEKHGRWNYYWVDSSNYYLVQWRNYNKDVLDGAFREIRHDSVMVGSYKNGLLNGDFRVYQPLTLWLLGVPPKNLSEDDLLCSGEYVNGKKTGHWKCYSSTKTLVKEGDYWDDMKHGEWRYYFDTYAQTVDGKTAPYSGQLFLIEHYLNGEKNGREERLAYLSETPVMCDTTIGTVNPLDTCFQLNLQKVREVTYFKNGELHGPLEWRDENDQIIRKGEYRMGKRWGPWLVLQVDQIDSTRIYRFEATYDNDQLQGDFKKYDAKTDILLTSGSYYSNKKSGIWTDYYPDANKRINTQTDFYADKRNFVKEFNYYGQLYLFAQYQDGNMVTLEKMDTIHKKVMQRFDHLRFNKGIYDFDLTEFGDSTLQGHMVFEAGSIEQEQDPFFFYSTFHFIAQINPNSIYLEGPFSLKDKTGRLLEEGFFKKGELAGVWKYYYYDQQVTRLIQYEAGTKILEQYFRIGSTKPFSGKFLLPTPNEGGYLIIKIKNGLRHGYTLKYDRQGNLIKKTKYKSGKKVEN